MAYDPDPIRGGKIAIQAKLYTKTVAPTHVRDLWGTVQHEGALKGIMVTTSGYGPDSYKFAAGKPLTLIDGTGLLALCQKHGISARILNTGSQRPSWTTRATPTFPTAPASHAPERNGDGTALTTPEAASNPPWSLVSGHSDAGRISSSSARRRLK